MDENLAELLKAIKNDWALVDESDSETFYILVNSDREKHPRLKPLKSYVNQIENEGLIVFEPSRSDAKVRNENILSF